MTKTDEAHKLGRIIIVLVVTICLTTLYWLNPDINPDIIEKILILPLAYIVVKGTGKPPM